MNTIFVSSFAERLDGYIQQKRALGFSLSNISDMRMFDRMCAEKFPNESSLTSDICNAFAEKNGNECVKTTARRLPFIREFARYLIRNGETAYILPSGITPNMQRYIPHIYSTAELTEMFYEIGKIPSTRTYPVANIVMPVLFHLLYSCGLRPSEALKLKTEDVNLFSGKLFIEQSKKSKDRIVMLSDDIRGLCCDYDKKVDELIPERKFFFPKNQSDICEYRWLTGVFANIRENLHIETANGKPPRLYDLRHTFATHRLYQWMKDGKDLHVMLPYLKAYMGHENLSDTFYYIHLVPGMIETMSDFKFESAENLFPKAVEDDD